MINDLMLTDGVFYVRMDQCETGQVAKARDGTIEGLARKTTGWITNAKCVAEELDKFQCRNRLGDESNRHEHVHLLGGRASAAECYTPELVNAVLRGFVRQLEIDANDRDDVPVVMAMEQGVHMDTDATDWDGPGDIEREFIDEISGALLDPTEVRIARQEEIAFVRDFGVYVKVPEEQAAGKPIISVKWVDINKGDEERPEYRSRLVGRELKKWDPFMTGTFAATPPTETLRFMISNFMTDRWKRGKKMNRVLLVLDVSRAHFHPAATREVYVRLPEEDYEEGKIGLLKKTMYGTRDAAAGWEEYYCDTYEEAGYKVGQFCPCLFHHPEMDSEAWVHGDDMIIDAEEEDAVKTETFLKTKMLIKRRAMLGFDSKHDKTVTILNRIIELKIEGGQEVMTYEPDPRHVEIVVASLGLDQDKSKAVSTPGVKSAEMENNELLTGDMVRKFRSVCMRLAYMAVDLPHLLFSTKEASRCMSAPTSGAWARLKRVGRFLKGHPRCIQKFPRQGPVKEFRMMVDSDHAGCLRTRCSTSSCFLMRGSHLIRASSTTQKIQGLSTGESEFMAQVKGASVLLGAQDMARDLGYYLDAPILDTDSTAAIGISKRRGVGRVRHLHTPLLWIQGRVKRKELRVFKVDGAVNISDLGTKHLPADAMNKHLKAAVGT